MKDKVLETGKHARLIQSQRNKCYFISPIDNPLIDDTAAIRFESLEKARQAFQDLNEERAGFSVGEKFEIGIGYFQ